jgi:hypothetical protein
MATAAEYRQYARECMESARDSHNDAVRQQFLELATLWMTAAHRLDGQIDDLSAHRTRSYGADKVV